MVRPDRVDHQRCCVAQLHLVGPVVLGGRSYGLNNVDMCYLVSPEEAIEGTAIYGQLDGLPHHVNDDSVVHSSSSQADCYTVTPNSPIEPVGSLLLVLKFNAHAIGDFMDIGKVTATWTPTGTAGIDDRPRTSDKKNAGGTLVPPAVEAQFPGAQLFLPSPIRIDSNPAGERHLQGAPAIPVRCPLAIQTRGRPA